MKLIQYVDEYHLRHYCHGVTGAIGFAGTDAKAPIGVKSRPRRPWLACVAVHVPTRLAWAWRFANAAPRP